MKVCEIFTSIQGESSYAGKPCHFIRLTGCNLRCRYCDTTYSYTEGFDIDLKTLVSEIQRLARYRLFMITGGEPLLQEETFELSAWLMKQGFKVLIETNGSQPIKTIQKHATIIMDIKTPGSGMAEFNDLTNIPYIKAGDEVKFVLTDGDDYIWARDFIRQHKFKEGVEVLFSPAHKMLDPQKLSQWILRDGLDVRLNLQLHKIIFGETMRGV
ncbi:MAG: radical SAM protein [Thermodesulfovibrionales bacterium]|nr:radical SAM protein [Thermodesulfovibrionales bacterium]